MTFIVCEGVDGAGKSTVCDAVIQTLKKRFPNDKVEYLHFSQLKNDPIDEYALQFENYEPDSGRHIVCDRLHFGELVYGPLYRGKSALSGPAFRWVEMYLAARGATTWNVTAALETVQNRLKLRGEDYLQPEDVEHVWRRFQGVAETSLTVGGTAYTDKWDIWDIAEQIVADATYKESSAAEMFQPEYIGRSLPAVLLVGDTQGNSDPGVTAAPFMPRGQSSGTFLLKALPEGWWRRVGIVNASDVDVKHTLTALYNPPVVALGKNAHLALNKLDIQHGWVPHPQWVRRFHHNEQTQYGTLIREKAKTEETATSG